VSRSLLIILMAGVVGLGAGVAAFYGTRGPGGNAQADSCAASAPVAARLTPLARGEVAAFQVTAQPKLATNVGFKAPDGRDLKLSDLKGKAVLLNLWATWCAPCRHEMPALDKLQASLGDAGFEVVTVSIDTARNAERMRAFWEETQIKALVNYTDTSGKIFQDLKVAGRAFGMPTTVLIDAKGCELGYLAGPAEWASDDALRLMRAALMRAPS